MKEENIHNPWMGLDSYREGQTLYGRSREIQDLSMAIFHHRQTVVYGRSGIGKSSILHAGIFPEARRRGCLPISIRLNHFAETGYREQIIQAIKNAVAQRGGEWRDATPDKNEPQSLWEFFHRYQSHIDEEPIIPLIVIDQFEEIFTLNQNRQKVQEFFNDLADWFNDVMPNYLQESSLPQDQDEKGNSLFAGLQVNTSGNLYGEEMPCHIVFVLREDYLSYLERYSSSIPALKQNRYGLLPINYQQAIEIITKPREGLVTREVADAIIRHIVTDEITNDTLVDVAILSLYLSRLYEKKGTSQTISLELVAEQGNALLEDFYEEIVAPLDTRTVHYLEDILINTEGHRENVTMESLYQNEWIKPFTIKALEQAHLLRLFSYGNAQRVEFAHDVLCPIIVRRRNQRANLVHLKRSQRIGLVAFLVLIFLTFSGIHVTVNRLDEKERIRKQREQLTEMETSLIEKGAKKMLEEHDVYGAIQLLINSMEENPNPSAATATYERVLRQAMDSLTFSEDSCVARVHRTFSMCEGHSAVSSRSHNLVGVNDLTGTVVIIDAHTGSIVQCFSKYPIDNYYGTWSPANSHNWKWFIRNDRVYVNSENEDSCLCVTDIHPDDTRCLIIADDTTVLDCYLEYDGEGGYTRLCLHDFHMPVTNAAYTNDGRQIAVLTEDGNYTLFDAMTSTKIIDEGAQLTARELMDEVLNRQYNLLKERNMSGGKWSQLDMGNGVILYPLSIREIYVCDFHKKGVKKEPKKWQLHEPSQEVVKHIRAHLDTLSSLPVVLTGFTRSFYDDCTQDVRYEWPLTVNSNQERLALLRPAWRNASKFYVYGLYSHNGAIFFRKAILNEVHTLHFTEDDQYLVVNAGEDTEEVIYLPPLQTLLDSCKNMFFDWRMTDEERYQTYIHMND